MEYIYNILNENNKDCNFCDKIKENDYSEIKYLDICKNNYRNFLFCILDNFDIILSNSTDKKIDFPKSFRNLFSN